MKRLETTATAAPSTTTPTSIEPLAVCFRAAFALGVVAGLGVAFFALPWWWLVLAAGFPFVLLSSADLVQLGRHVVAALEPVVRVDLNGDGELGPRETIRFVPIRGVAEAVVEDVDLPESDLRWLVSELATRGPAWRKWLGAQLPSGRIISSYEDYKPFVELLEKIGALTDRGPRSAGKLTKSPAQIADLLGL